MARHRLSAALAGLVPQRLVSDAVAVVAELVGNAVRHAAPLPGGVIRVSWEVCRSGYGEALEVRVTDGGSGTPPRLRSAGRDSVDGRGLRIVAALADRWGVERDRLGQSVWARLS